MGETPKNIFVTGSIGVEKIINEELISKNKLQKVLRFKIDEKTILVSYHPETLNPKKSLNNFKNLISVLQYFKCLQLNSTKSK